MRKLWKILFAAALTVAAILSAPHRAAAINWCNLCTENGDCFSCCRCDGNSGPFCASHCS